MKIINSYRGGSLPEPNTFIGGVGATSVTSIADFIALTGDITAANISNFQIDSDNNVSFFCNSSYTLNDLTFIADLALTYYIDEKCTLLSRDSLNGTDNCDYYYFPNVTTSEDEVWQNVDNAQVISFPLCTPIGGSVTDDLVFGAATNLEYVITHADNETNNGGSPDGDLDASGIVNIKYAANTTAPSDISDLAVDDFLGTAISISWSAPSSTNAIIYYEVWINDALIELTSSTSSIISDLSLNTFYEIKIKVLDEFGNRSNFSNVVSQTTSATYQIPTGDIVSYYPLNANSNDSVGTNDGTDTSMSYDSGGVVGNRANFTSGTSSEIEVADDNSLTFGNGTTDSAFSISFWVKFNVVGSAIIISKEESTPREYDIYYISPNLVFRLFNNGVVSSFITTSYTWSPSNDVWYYITATYNGNGSHTGLTLYIDSVSGGSGAETGTYTAMNGTTAPLTIGKYSDSTTFSLNGYLDEISIFDIELSEIQVLEIKAKNDANLGLTE